MPGTRCNIGTPCARQMNMWNMMQLTRDFLVGFIHQDIIPNVVIVCGIEVYNIDSLVSVWQV